jgi:23S rRNA pseudouridine1911/1915/1917 synthase
MMGSAPEDPDTELDPDLDVDPDVDPDPDGTPDVSAPLEFELGSGQEGERIDAALSAVAGVPRSQIRRWIEAGQVRLNGKVVRPSRKVVAGDVVTATPLEVTTIEARPEAIPLDVLYSDPQLIVVDKAAGMVVHPAPGHHTGTLVNALLHHCDDLAGVGGALRPGIVHRLDRGTSGVMVAAKTDIAHRGLSAQFHDHTIERVYWAFVRTLPGADRGTVDRPIGRHPRDRKKMSVRPTRGRRAVSHWKVMARFSRSGISQLEVRPETGRTHQIRVHLSSAGMPLAGDPVYGRGKGTPRGPESLLDRPALHAASLAFDHPLTGERMRFEAPLPNDLADFLGKLEGGE